MAGFESACACDVSHHDPDWQCPGRGRSGVPVQDAKAAVGTVEYDHGAAKRVEDGAQRDIVRVRLAMHHRD